MSRWVQGPRGRSQDQPRGSLASYRMEIKQEPAGGESRGYRRYRESRYRRSPWETQEGAGVSSLFGVWHPGTGQNKDEGPRVTLWSQGPRVGMVVQLRGLELPCDGFSPGPSWDVIYCRAVTDSVSLTGRTHTVCTVQRV